MSMPSNMPSPPNVIPSEMKPIGEPNSLVEENIQSNMHEKIDISLINNSDNHPCLLDETQLSG